MLKWETYLKKNPHKQTSNQLQNTVTCRKKNYCRVESWNTFRVQVIGHLESLLWIVTFGVLLSTLMSEAINTEKYAMASLHCFSQHKIIQRKFKGWLLSLKEIFWIWKILTNTSVLVSSLIFFKLLLWIEQNLHDILCCLICCKGHIAAEIDSLYRFKRACYML